jgi:hypothetical protein
MMTLGGNEQKAAKRIPFYVLLLILAAAVTLAAQRRGTPNRPSQLRTVEIKEPNGQILSYRYLAASTDVTMRGTKLAPQAHIRLKVGSRPGFVELDINRGQITGLKPASQFGLDFLTYVLWAVSVDGKAANLGEITFVDDKPVSINVTTPYQTFWLMLTAEPSYAVVDPSPLVVLYSTNESPDKPEKTAQTIPGGLFFFTHYGDYDRKPTSEDRAPNPLLQARKAVELASKSGILVKGNSGASVVEEARTREALRSAQDFLGRAETAYKENPNGNDVAQLSRTSAQIAENARALALGAVGGALVNQLEREVDRLRTELAARDALPPPPVPVETTTVPVAASGEPIMPKPQESASTETVNVIAEVMRKPLTWFAVGGWLLAVLLLFRRRSI